MVTRLTVKKSNTRCHHFVIHTQHNIYFHLYLCGLNISTECFHIRVTCKRTIHIKAVMTHMIWVKRGSFLFNQSIKYASINHPSHQPFKHSFIKSSINQQQLNASDVNSFMHAFFHLTSYSFGQSINQSIDQNINHDTTDRSEMVLGAVK